MGIFSVNMPLLYGEGNRAFIRLQEEIMRQSDDHSLFAWLHTGQAEQTHNYDGLKCGLLADSPDYFWEAGAIIPYSNWGEQVPYAMTNRGLHIELHIFPADLEGDVCVAALNRPNPAKSLGGFLGIYLLKVGQANNQFARVRCGRLASIRGRGGTNSDIRAAEHN